MSAERLRAAATVLRERATMATPGPWREGHASNGNPYRALVADAPHPDRMKGGGWEWDEHYGGCLVGESHMAADRRYLATVHPGVGLELADWLDEIAALADAFAAAYGGGEPIPVPEETLSMNIAGWERALRVADLILGGGA